MMLLLLLMFGIQNKQFSHVYLIKDVDDDRSDEKERSTQFSLIGFVQYQ